MVKKPTQQTALKNKLMEHLNSLIPTFTEIHMGTLKAKFYGDVQKEIDDIKKIINGSANDVELSKNMNSKLKEIREKLNEFRDKAGFLNDKFLSKEMFISKLETLITPTATPKLTPSPKK